jgi:vancomycin permeability regulator SanA
VGSNPITSTPYLPTPLSPPSSGRRLRPTRLVRKLAPLVAVVSALVLGNSLWMTNRYGSTQPASADVALVLGAGIRPDGTPTAVLQARVMTAADLYRRGAVRKLVMSGDNSRAIYDEVTAMKAAAVKAGVPSQDILLDYAGFRTLDSCVRIRKVFGQQRVVLVTQEFHIARARFLCADAGVIASAEPAPDPRGSTFKRQSKVREVLAQAQAVVDAKILQRQPKFLGPAIDVDNPPPEALEQPLAPEEPVGR